MLRVVLVVLLGLWASVVQAADIPVIAPAPAWVVPGAPGTPAALDTASGPLGFLLLDRQLHFGPEGDSEYLQRVVQIRSTVGLAAMGSVAVPWSPVHDALTIHKLHILREGKVIDVLKTQTFAVIRREANFDSAILDGVLTATIQPEGLQVGDVVDLAYTLTRNNPVLQGRSESYLEMPAIEQIDRARLRATWSAPKAPRWRVTEGLGAPKISRARGQTELLLDLRDVKRLTGPSGAPGRFTPVRRVEFSEFQSWAELSSLLAPLYVRASTLGADSPLKAEAAKIRAASSDPKVRAAMALKLVQDRVRYLALLMKDGGLDPIDADVTWSTRFGDCKAKTALLIALLRELDIEAEPAAVNSSEGDGLDASLPGASAFDHVLVRAVVAGKVYWLDGTRTGDGALDSIRVPDFHWALPLRPAGAVLVALTVPPLEQPDTDVMLRVDASGGLDAPAPAHGEMILRGDSGRLVSLGVGVVSAADRDTFLRTMWEGAYPWITVKTTSLTIAADTGEVRLVMDGVAKPRWSVPVGSGPRWFFVPATRLGWKADYKREPGPHADAPFTVKHPTYTVFKFVFVLPWKGDGFSTEGADIDTKVAGRALYRRTRLERGVVSVDVSTRTLAPEFPAAEAPAANKTLTEMAKTMVAIRAAGTYWPTEKDTAALAGQAPETVKELIERAERYTKAGKFDAALVDLNKAIALDSKSAHAVANRGMAYYFDGKYDLAQADFDKALVMDPRNVVAVHGLGVMAMRSGRYAEAVTIFSRATDLLANNRFALSQRATAYWFLRDGDKALADLDELMKIEPGAVEVRVMRFQIYSTRNQSDRAIKEMDAAIAETPKDAKLYVFRGGMLGRLGRRQEAQRDFDSAIALEPRAETHLTMALYRDRTDYESKLADIAAAERLDPDNLQIVTMRARVLSDQGKHDQAIAMLTRAASAHPDDDSLLVDRASALIRAGRATAGLKDLATIRARNIGEPMALNSLCWTQATLGVAFEAALADCDAALKINPSLAAIIDSRAFVLMRLGRNKEALEVYNEAVRLRPYQAESLYGRGIVRLRLGATAEGQADLAAARAAMPKVDEDFAEYGLKPGA